MSGKKEVSEKKNAFSPKELDEFVDFMLKTQEEMCRKEMEQEDEREKEREYNRRFDQRKIPTYAKSLRELEKIANGED